MQWDDMSFFILNTLSNGDKVFHNGTFKQLKDDIINGIPEYTTINNPIYNTAKRNAELDKDLTNVLAALIRDGFLREDRNEIFRGGGVYIEIKYGITPKTRAYLKNIELNGRITNHDKEAINYLLKHIPWHGNIELTKLKLVAHEERVHIEIPNVERLLIAYGFCEQIYYDYEENLYFLHLTDKGRDLKKCGSLNSFNKIEDEREANIHAVEIDRKEAILRNKMQFEMNRHQLWVNACIAIATAIAAIYYIREMLKGYNFVSPDLKSVLILLIFGMCIGGTILAVVQEVVKRNK